MKKNRLYGRGVPVVYLKKLFRMTKLGIFFLFFLCISAWGEGRAQQMKVTLDMHNVTLEQVLKALKQQTGMRMFYSVEKVRQEKRTALSMQAVSLEEALKIILEGTPLTYTLQEDVIVIREADRNNPVTPVLIKGMVKDKAGNPLPGVSVVVKGTTWGTASDVDGRFAFPVNGSGEQVLVFSFVGMQTKEMPYTGQADFTVVLEEEQSELNEVVCTGYQTLSRERVTGSFSVISSEQIMDKTPMNFMERLEGMAPGLFIHKGEYSIRGISTFDDAKPLVVVDGFPIEGDVESVNPNDIEQVTILKDAAASSIWGAKASNGVIVITTKSGKTGGRKYINYTDDFLFDPIPDYNYLDHANAEETVKFQREAAPYLSIYNSPQRMYFAMYNPVQKIYEEYLRDVDPDDPVNAERVEMAEQKFRELSKWDNRQQLKEYLLKTSFKQQHNFTISGSNERNAHYISINYNSEQGGYVGYRKQNMIFNVKEIIQLMPKLAITLGANFSFGKGTDSNVNKNWFNLCPYDMLADEKGNPLPVYYNKTIEEIDYRKEHGGADETIVPLDELHRYSKKNKTNNNRLFAVLNYKICDGLTIDVRYQMEKGFQKKRIYSSPDSWEVAKLRNEYWYRDESGDMLKSLIPAGGMMEETRGDSEAYSLRASLDFNKTLGKHEVNAVLGGERSAVKNTSTTVKKVGYDEQTMLYEPVDWKGKSSGSSYTIRPEDFDHFAETEDRFVAFFGNLSYLYNNRYSLTASARIDQSNLFGTDPKYRYTPLWSAGIGWDVAKESFFKADWIDRLHFRVTYGINGYASKKAGPFLILERKRSNYTNQMGNTILSYPNNKLRWEKTATTNFAVDYAFLNNRLSGKLEYYLRKTTDVLGNVDKDPTLGMRYLTENTASISNHGVELELNTVNVAKAGFKWTSHLVFSYNKNKITHVVTDLEESAAYSWTWDAILMKGKPKDVFYRYRWAGLSQEGNPQVYDADGNIVEPQTYDDMNDKNALVYKGTIHPVYTASFTNVLSYKGFELSLMLIMNGGHKMKNDIFGGELPGRMAVHKDVSRRWQRSGDEQQTDIPRIDFDDRDGGTYSRSFYRGADIHILNATYIKLREVLLTYKLPEDLFRRLPVSGIRLKAQVSNLWYWAANKEGIDPEVHDYASGARSLPMTPTWSFGVNVTF